MGVVCKKCGYATEMMIVATILMNKPVIIERLQMDVQHQNFNVAISDNVFHQVFTVMAQMIAKMAQMRLDYIENDSRERFKNWCLGD